MTTEPNKASKYYYVKDDMHNPVVYGPGNSAICKVYGPNAKERTAFIVRAYNNYDRLLAACKRLLKCIKINGGLEEYNGGLAFILEEVEAAIAAAEKEVQ